MTIPFKPLPTPPGGGKQTPTPPAKRRPKPLPTPPLVLPPPGGLLHAMQRCHEGGDMVGVVLIDEGDAAGEHPETAAQRQVLALAEHLGLQVLAVEIDTALAHGGMTPGNNTRGEFRRYVHHTVKKPLFNAFDENAKPPMQSALNDLGLFPGTSKLVIMGYNTNQCVRLTAVGGINKPNQPPHRGATQRGYEVLTCQAVLRGGACSWSDALRVHFFPHL